MQTFLPFADFSLSAESLDNKRLNKQIVESYQILKAITDSSYGWQNHPIVNMWRGYSATLMDYIQDMDFEYRERTSKMHKAYKLASSFWVEHWVNKQEGRGYPIWLNYEPFHISHRMNLIRKDASYLNSFRNYLVDIDTNDDMILKAARTYEYLWFDPKQEKWYTTNKGKRSYL